MAFNGAGVYVLPVTSFTPAVGGQEATPAGFNTLSADLETALSLCLTEDGQNVPTANLPMATYRHTGVGNATALTDYASATQVINGTLLYAGASVAGTDTYAGSLPISPGSYSTGLTFFFKSDVANTGACTYNLNALGAKNIKLADGNDPYTGAIPINSFPVLQYDGTNLILLNPWASLAGLGVTATAAELNYNDIATLGTAQASKAVTSDAAGVTKTLKLDEATTEVVDVVDVTKKLKFEVTSATTGTTATIASAHTANCTITLPNATDTLVGRGTVDTLTNKTLTTPVVNGAVSGTAFTVIDMGVVTDVTVVTAAHGITGQPKVKTLWLQNITNDLGYVVGDKILPQGNQQSMAVWADATNVKYYFDIARIELWSISGVVWKPFGGVGGFTAARWKVFVEVGL